MAEPLKKEDLKEVFIESLEPFANAIKADFDRIDKKLDEAKKGRGELKTDVVSLKVGLQEVKTDLAEIKENIGNTFTKLDEFLVLYKKLDQEFTMMKEDIRKIKKVVKEKLGVVFFKIKNVMEILIPAAQPRGFCLPFLGKLSKIK